MDTSSRKGRYVAKAINMLKQEGFRLSLDEMANKMGIAKKTLCNNSSSKDELLRGCVYAISEGFQSVLSMLEEGASNPIESLTKCSAQLDELFATLNPVFFSDLVRSNPDQATFKHLMGSRYFEKMMTTSL